MTIEIILLGASGFLRGDLPQKVIQEIEDCLKYRPEEYEYSEAYLNGSWDGWVKLFNQRTRKFPIGLLSQINNLNYKIVDKRLVLAGAGKSQVKAVQKVGLGLRTYNGKKNVRIVDVNDKGTRYLNEHSIESLKSIA